MAGHVTSQLEASDSPQERRCFACLFIFIGYHPHTSKEVFRMVGQMLIDEAGHEEVAVIIAGLATQDQRVVLLGADRLQTLRLELLFQELVILALLDEQLLTRGTAVARLLDQLAGIPLRPLGAVIAEDSR